MPIQGNIGNDAQLMALINDAAAKDESKNNKSSAADDANDAAVRAALKKIDEQKATLRKQTTVDRETFQKDANVGAKWNEALNGKLGSEVQKGAQAWANSPELQDKLTSAQKRLFQEALVNNPKQAGEAGAAMARLAEQPGFEKAVNTFQQMGTLQHAVLNNPAAEKPVAQLLQQSFMQSSKAEPASKDAFMRFGLAMNQKGNLGSVKAAGDMLGTLVKTGTPKFAQRASMNMMLRNSDNVEGAENVDKFAQNTAQAPIGAFARGKGIQLLAKADGKKEVAEGFEKLTQDSTFRTQSKENQGRFFSTIGSGRPSQFRAITDQTLLALQTQGFPQRSGQVKKFLNKMSTAVKRGGAGGVNVKQLIKSSKGSAFPPVPALVSEEGLDGEELAKARSQNRAKVIQYYTQVSRHYDEVDKKLAGAKYFEDVNSLSNMRDAETIDTSKLHPDEKKLVDAKAQQTKTRAGGLKKAVSQKMRELRTKRMPPAKRRQMEAARRSAGQKPKYYRPVAGGRSGASMPLPGRAQAQTTTRTAPMPGAQNTPPDARGQVRAGTGRTPAAQTRQSRGASGGQGTARGAKVSKQSYDAILQEELNDIENDPNMSDTEKNQMKRLLRFNARVQGLSSEDGSAGSYSADDAGPAGASQAQQEAQAETRATARRGAAGQSGDAKRTQNGKVDGWGVQRTFVPELGANQTTPVRPKDVDAGLDAGPSPDQVANERYTGRKLVKSNTQVRDLETMYSQKWKGLSKAESALWANLGWSQQTWDTKSTPAARWPQSMRTPFAQLGPVQRESVRNLGLSADDWDSFVSSASDEDESVQARGGSAGA